MIELNESVEERLDRLERKCRTLRLWCAGSTGLLLVACAAAALAPDGDVVRARRFEAVDGEGRVRAVLAGAFDVGVSGAGLRIGTLIRGDEEEEGSSILLQVLPVNPDPSGAGAAKTGAILTLAANEGDRPATFNAFASGSIASYAIASDYRSVATRIEPGKSSIDLTTRDEDTELAAGADDYGTVEDHPRLELRVEGNDTTIRGSTKTGEALFHVP